MVKIMIIVGKFAAEFPELFKDESVIIERFRADKDLEAKIGDAIKAVAEFVDDLTKAI